MGISKYSVATAIVWFSVAALVGSRMMRKASRSGLIFIGSLFLLSFIRVALPLEFARAAIIHSTIILPRLTDLLRSPLIGRITVGRLLLIVWAAGTMVGMARMFWGMQRQKQFRKSAVRSGEKELLSALACQVAAEYGCKRMPVVSVSAQATTAYQTGFLRPFILLPGTVTELNSGHILNMLRHEMCHYLGFDLWIKLGLQFIACLLWWNPAVYCLNRSVDQMLELRCDKRVCHRFSQEEKACYLRTLLLLVQNIPEYRTSVSMGYVGTAEEKDLIQRFHMVMNCEKRSVPMVKTIGCVLLCALMLGASYSVILQPWHPVPDEYAEEPVVSEPERTFILHTLGGKYELYSDERCIGFLSEAQLLQEPYCDLSIYEESDT